MATSLRASSTNSAATGTAISVSAPSGTSPGDLVVISVHGNGNTTIVDNNGSTPFTEDFPDYSPNTASGHTVALFSRRIQAGDPSTYNFTLGASNRWSIVADAWKNPHATDKYDVAPSTANAANADDSASATINAPSITTLTPNAIHVVCGYFDDGAAGLPSGPAGYSNGGNENDEPQVVAYAVIPTAGATGAQTVTGATASPRIALSYAIKDEGVTVDRWNSPNNTPIREKAEVVAY